MASKPPCTAAEFFPARIAKSDKLDIATAGAFPCRTRGIPAVIETARNNEFCAACLLCRYRLRQPSVVDSTLGVADSMYSCASKCERVLSGEPAASTIANRFESQSGLNRAIAG